jgi:hypothetical protein
MEGRWEIKYHPRTKADEDCPTTLEPEEDEGLNGGRDGRTRTRCLAVRVLTQRLRETTPTENLVGRDVIRRQSLHSAPLSLG